MAWFLRKKKNIITPIEDRKDLPKGLWYRTPNGKIIDTDELKKNAYVSPEDGYHVRIHSKEYFDILFDNGKFSEKNVKMISKDPIKWMDRKKYTDRIEEARKKTNLYDAIRTGVGKINGIDIVISCMDFSFIGGSMGSVVGEKISRAIKYCIEKRFPYVLISKSGGARIMESSFSLMQMAKTIARLTQLRDSRIPYLSILTDPTTGGVTASYALLGDINIAEPGALIGFAGPRVIRETIRKNLPDGFQTSEFLLENGFIDLISSRIDLKKNISNLISMMM
ncbi:acetyl-CoA carboxylase, carboxyltransferase subunit beta [Blattabacterium punctulatus]|uniref:acetyl-CoA carboxylase, carboxyltransferase subunit beta n=1 Tax=Blattabacterium punctulatus TaxID=164514 RepID=UPI000D7CDB24|nr:acetyl-CoA carboxylase, carboxyltransferase subunit beta [Blattabacterium punctulatus]AWU42766.1 acetyl-CoA carboxylase, carboxyltransferase subunit beta [Blattabacterium punctulatus]AWU43312.1 acetyl-CoA carboxylase, carboxyltransferase subunit beta [Blattabacterium punctulatus]AWU44973.1 acetyl-CoA carboxylase, carboxyltransferase subunit beta [Blattabacterium punctulatus]AWU46049.1 acetyl-CoA carboxylase, carboxyltransferase subunit beta [Blattabacterium punctulatus]